MARKKNNGRGWFNESENHAKAAKGQKVRSQQAKLDVGKGVQTKLTIAQGEADPLDFMSQAELERRTA